MAARTHLEGQVFGRLTVVRETMERSADGSIKWECRCECGSTCLASTNNLRSGDGTKSCGCLSRENFHGKITHGRTRGYSEPPEYRVWCTMRERCSNPKNHKYISYGARGIAVCDRWLDFGNFIADMGLRPSPCHSIDRINNDGNYEPGNCRWATPKEQANNRRPRKNTTQFIPVTISGVTCTVIEWSKINGISISTATRRIESGWSPNIAVTHKLTRGHRPKELYA